MLKLVRKDDFLQLLLSICPVSRRGFGLKSLKTEPMQAPSINSMDSRSTNMYRGMMEPASPCS